MNNEVIIEKNINDENINTESSKEMPKKNFKDSIYGNIDVSVETMDKVITVLLITLAASFILGVIL